MKIEKIGSALVIVSLIAASPTYAGPYQPDGLLAGVNSPDAHVMGGDSFTEGQAQQRFLAGRYIDPIPFGRKGINSGVLETRKSPGDTRTIISKEATSTSR